MFGGSSSSVKTFLIVLDNPLRSYFPGQIVAGRLILELERERKTSGVKLNFVGRAKVKWTEPRTVTTGTGSTRRTHTEHKTYSDEEVYFDRKLYVIGASGGPELQIQPGHHEFPFTFQLPMGIPSSFTGKYGHVQYSVSATLKKSWGFDKTTTIPFTVNGIVDLNTTPGAEMSSQINKEKHLGCLCCKDGPIWFAFRLNRSGFVPGEALDFAVELNNQSSKPIPRIQVRLNRNVSFHARGKAKNETGCVLGYDGPGVKAHETEIWRSSPSHIIHAIPPTNLGGCRIIRVGYSIEVEMEIPSGFNLKGSTGIIIGTIPFRNTFAQMRPHVEQPATPGLHPSAPPLHIEGYPDLPLPSYEDAFGELPTYAEACGDEADGGGGDTKNKNGIPFDPNFVPKYVTYGWNNSSRP